MMRTRFHFTLAVCLLMMSAVAARATAGSSGVVSAIEKKYAVTETTSDGEQITKDGTTMAMKCPGVYALPMTAFMKPDNKVVDGKVQKMNAFSSAMLTNTGAHVLQTGDKVYITKIESKSNGKGDQLQMTLLTLDSLDVKNSDNKKKYEATVTFNFKKGYLDDAPPEEVEQVIESVLAPDSSSSDASSAGPAQPSQQAAAPPPAPPVQRAAAPPAPAGPPPTISIGESSTQVLQAMGMPLQMIDLGKKKTFIYKDMKITFVDDKVSDMQ